MKSISRKKIFPWNQFHEIFFFRETSDDPPKKTEFQWCDGLGLVIICTGLGYLGIGYSYFVRNTLRNSKAFLLLVSKLASCVQNKAVQILIYIMVILSVVIFLVLDTYNDRRRLISASGVIVLVLICTVASKHPKKINWRQVFTKFKNVSRAFIKHSFVYNYL